MDCLKTIHGLHIRNCCQQRGEAGLVQSDEKPGERDVTKTNVKIFQGHTNTHYQI